MKLFLLSVVLMLALVSCPQPFNLIESLDGPEGLSLSISPESAQVVITESITITAEGGAPPYIFSISSGSGSIDAVTGVYTAPAVLGTDTVQVTDSYGATRIASIGIISGAGPAPLSISPTSITVYIGSNATFTGSGGELPYTFSISAGTGTIDPLTGVYTAPPAAGTDTVRITDTFGTTVDATVTVSDIVTNVDYTLSALNDTSPTYIGGDAVSGDFTITNSGTVAGGQPITWEIYFSSDANYGTGDTLIDTSTTAALGAGSSTAPITFSGSWPDTANTYYLIAKVTALDDITTANNALASGGIVVTAPEVDYRVDPAIVPPGGTSTFTGSAISENFSIENIGTSNGADTIYWTAYVSDNNVLGVGTDSVIDSGTRTALNGGAISPAINFTGNWPVTPGNYFLIVDINSGDDTNTANNASPSTLAYTIIQPLSISPDIVSVNVGGNLSFAGSGGVPPYLFSITTTASGTPSIDINTGAYLAGNTPTFIGDIIEIRDSAVPQNTATATVIVTDIITNVNYTSVTVTNTGSTVGGGSLTGEFTFENIESADGGQTVNWEVYVSTDAFIGAGDDLVDSGTTTPLSAWATSAAIPFTGTWPSIGNTYNLIVKVSASDDVTTADNTGSTAVAVSNPDINYTVSSMPAGGTTIQTGSAIAESFAVQNIGVDAGSDTIYWIAYISANNTLEIGTDTVIDSGTRAAVAGSTTSAAINFSGTWSGTPGSYFLIVDLAAADDAAPGNNTVATAASYTVSDPDIDYTVTAASITTNNNPAVGGSAISESFTITNSGTDNGNSTVYWTAYISTDAAFDNPGDTPIDSGQTTALTAGTESGAINIDNGTWPTVSSDTDYYLFVDVSAFDELPAKIDAGNQDSALFSITVPDIDYEVNSVTNGTTPADISTDINETFIFQNTGADNGSSDVLWTAYSSTDQILDAGDSIIATGQESALNTGTTSSPITIAGTWSATSGAYYIIVKVSASDETDTLNNYNSSGVFTINAPADLDYIITSVSSNFLTVTTGSPVSETFDLTNAGGLAGAAVVNWEAFICSSPSFDGGEVSIGTGSTGALGSGVSATNIPISTTWPGPAGSFYLIMELTAADETITGNNTNSSGPFTVYDPPDYSVVFDPSVENTGQTGAALSGSPTFTISNGTVNDGMNPITWRIYRSTDQVLGGGDVEVDSGVETAITGSNFSQLPINASWPAIGDYYFLIITIGADDDEYLANNQSISAPIAVGDYVFAELEPNDAVASAAPPTSWDPGSTTGITLASGETAAYTGIMDLAGASDIYSLTTGAGVTELSFLIRWETGFDDIDFKIYSAAGTELYSSVDTSIYSEPASTASLTGFSQNTDYYIGINFYLAGDTSGSTGEPYSILISAP